MIINVKQNCGFDKFSFRHFLFLAIILQKAVNVVADIYSDFPVVFIIFI